MTNHEADLKDKQIKSREEFEIKYDGVHDEAVSLLWCYLPWECYYLGWMENEECGVRSAECGKCRVWKVRSVENAEYGKCGVWNMRSMENAECGKCGVWKMRSVWKCINVDRFIHFKAF